jgi:hypothetical protein
MTKKTEAFSTRRFLLNWKHNHICLLNVNPRHGSILYIQPDVRLAAAVAAHGMAARFARFLGHDVRFQAGIGRLFFRQGAGNFHFGFIAAVFTSAHLFEFLLRHENLLEDCWERDRAAPFPIK